jgi:tRNA A-37 threonylcarbamoyl transferase component Bud32
VAPEERCNEGDVRAVIDGAAERRLLGERQAREGARRVELLDGRHVLKRFRYAAGERPVRRPWRREHAALIHLADARLPKSVGYLTEADEAAWTVSYLRTWIPGEPLTEFDAASATEAGALLAGLHARGVVTDDALTQNFLRAPDGQLLFLDFGKSRILPRLSPFLPAWIALEHCRFLRAALAGDVELWETFRDAYFTASGRGRSHEATVRGLSRVVLRARHLQGRSR